MVCKCGNQLLTRYPKKTKLRASILVWDEDNDFAIAKCKRCGSEERVPVVLHKSYNVAAPTRPQIFVVSNTNRRVIRRRKEEDLPITEDSPSVKNPSAERS